MSAARATVYRGYEIVVEVHLGDTIVWVVDKDGGPMDFGTVYEAKQCIDRMIDEDQGVESQ